MYALQLFEPNPNAVYTIDIASRLAGVPWHTILVYYKHGLVSVVLDSRGGYYFDDEAIRVLRRIEFLRQAGGINLAGIKLALDLLAKVQHLEAELRFFRR